MKVCSLHEGYSILLFVSGAINDDVSSKEIMQRYTYGVHLNRTVACLNRAHVVVCQQLNMCLR